MPLHRHLLACCSLTFGLLNLTFWCLPLVILVVVGRLLPHRRPSIERRTRQIYRMAVGVNDWWFRSVLGYRWRHCAPALNPEQTCIAIANHQSWADSFLIQSALASRGPIVKMLVKQQLMWIPLLALIFWAYEFPRLKRRSVDPADEPERRKTDVARIREACERLKTAPGAMLVYPEGTRFNSEKHARLDSPYTHLLPPKARGFEILVEGLNDVADTVLDITIRYPESSSFWQFLSGSVQEPTLHITETPLREISAPATWLVHRWEEKDRLLGGN